VTAAFVTCVANRLLCVLIQCWWLRKQGFCFTLVVENGIWIHNRGSDSKVVETGW